MKITAGVEEEEVEEVEEGEEAIEAEEMISGLFQDVEEEMEGTKDNVLQGNTTTGMFNNTSIY